MKGKAEFKQFFNTTLKEALTEIEGTRKNLVQAKGRMGGGLPLLLSYSIIG